jgi:hypothetical protein
MIVRSIILNFSTTLNVHSKNLQAQQILNINFHVFNIQNWFFHERPECSRVYISIYPKKIVLAHLSKKN